MAESPGRILLEKDMSGPERFACGSFDVVAYTSPCPGGDRKNEDALAIVPFGNGGLLLAVADGLGGRPAGGRAAGIVLDCLAGALRGEAAHPREAILNGIEHANRDIQALGVGAGTTLAAVEIRESAARAYHVGDSEILIVGQRGRIRFQSVPHSPVGYGVEAGLIDREDALEHDERHLIFNALGSPDMRIDIGPVVKLRQRDVILLASDGLFDNLHLNEIVETVRKGKLLVAAKKLAREGAGRMTEPAEGDPSKPDDLTFVACRRTRYGGDR